MATIILAYKARLDRPARPGKAIIGVAFTTPLDLPRDRKFGRAEKIVNTKIRREVVTASR